MRIYFLLHSVGIDVSIGLSPGCDYNTVVVGYCRVGIRQKCVLFRQGKVQMELRASVDDVAGCLKKRTRTDTGTDTLQHEGERLYITVHFSDAPEVRHAQKMIGE